ncbi:hypothetical protein SAMN05877809_10577 [Rhodobacter sp. JA431]|uniref:hypothetical protein n=1 Tax=Rhodobacter sp. JA431 TaxID=570013 RepID=UPI000BD3C10C|nr:hypothetical protein [Rhodobacter sp. JA431]SOC10162.1 hypothetical protein SAMN05877809_10577 [Rhodobacter sp. JA431]
MNVAPFRNYDGRERSNTYSGEIWRAGRWRVIACADNWQWAIQRQRDGEAGLEALWDNRMWFRSRGALLRFWHQLSGKDGSALEAMLPERFKPS